LTDRFALSVEIRGIDNARDRVQIIQNNVAFEADPEGFRQEWLPHEQELAEKIVKARKMVDQVKYTTRDLLSIAGLTSSLHVDGHRADLVILKAARAQAAFDGRVRISDMDIAIAAELALPHRIRRGPFQQSEIRLEELHDRIGDMHGEPSSEGEPRHDPSTEGKEQAREKKKT